MSTQRMHIAGYGHDDTAPELSRTTTRTVLDTVTSYMRQMLTGIIRERALRRAEKELMALDDRMLKDIGLCRSEIASAVRNPGDERLNGAQAPLPYPF